MLTWQDLAAVGDNERERMEFVLSAIREHETSKAYRTAVDAEMYYRHLNPTIMRAQKFLYDVLGRRVEDVFAANHKIPSRLYFYFITQRTGMLLGNGVSFSNPETKDKLGLDFDHVVQTAAIKALNGGVSFVFWNYDHAEVFALAGLGSEPSFAPIYDELNGTLMAGVRWWQIDKTKPLRATLYEPDGYTEYIRPNGEEIRVLAEKKSYVQIVEHSAVSGDVIYNGDNYPSLPIIPLYNINQQSEIVGSRETLDAYDLMASTLVNNVDDANIIYWVIKNAGAMDDTDDAEFVRRLKTTHVAHVDGAAGTEIQNHSVEAPFEANDNALKRLRSQLFDDFMALDTKEIANGAATATQIEAAYEPLNSMCDALEYQITDFILRLLRLVGIDDAPTYTRSKIVNRAEELQNLIAASSYLSEEYVTSKALEIMGDIDKIEDVQMQREAEEAARYTVARDDEGGES